MPQAETIEITVDGLPFPQPEFQPVPSIAIPHIPRSFQESPSYDPSWRSLVAQAYETAAADAGGFVDINEYEDDPLIRQYFWYRTSGICTEAGLSQAISYAESCISGNATHGVATRIRAMTLAGYHEDEIADLLLCSPRVITIFQDLFFDVRRYLAFPHVIRAIVLGPTFASRISSGSMETLDSESARDRIACTIALSGDINQLECVLNPTTVFDEAAMERMTRNIAFMTVARAHDRSVIDSGIPVPQKSAHYLFLEQAKVRAIERQIDNQAQNAEAASMEDFGKRMSELWTASPENEEVVMDLVDEDIQEAPRKKPALSLRVREI